VLATNNQVNVFQNRSIINEIEPNLQIANIVLKKMKKVDKVKKKPDAFVIDKKA